METTATQQNKVTETRNADSRRYNGKCHHCGAKHSVLGAFRAMRVVPPSTKPEYVLVATNGEVLVCYGGGAFIRDCACSRPVGLRPVLGKFVRAKKCDARCTNATGHNCECQCGGKNHGAGYEAAS